MRNSKDRFDDVAQNMFDLIHSSGNDWSRDRTHETTKDESVAIFYELRSLIDSGTKLIISINLIQKWIIVKHFEDVRGSISVMRSSLVSGDLIKEGNFNKRTHEQILDHTISLMTEPSLTFAEATALRNSQLKEISDQADYGEWT